MLAQSLMLCLAMLSCGLWLIDGWLRASVWRFLIWWGACGLVTLWVLAFAVYDALAVVREEREAVRGVKSPEDSPCDE